MDALQDSTHLTNIRQFWKFESTNYTNFTNAESPLISTFSNNTPNISTPKVHSDDFCTVVKLVKLVNSNFQKHRSG